MRPGRREGRRSDKKDNLRALWEALKEQPPGHISSITTKRSAPTPRGRGRTSS